MKKLILTTVLSAIALNVYAVEKETIEIVKPIIALKEATINDGDSWGPRGGANVEAKTSGSFQSTFASKYECIAWTKSTVQTLKTSSKIIYSATCSNAELAPLYFDAGHFVGNVSYL